MALPDGTIYLDHAATTPSDPRVVARMAPYFRDCSATPAASIRWAARAWPRSTRAHETVARALNCRPTEIVFTGGGSEADNLAIKGVAYAQRRRVATTSSPPPSSITPCCTPASNSNSEGYSRHLSAG